MPSKPRPGVRPVYVELPEDLAAQLEALAESNRRKLKAEIVLAIEAHLAAHPSAKPAKPKKPQKGE
jgi:hypothetical protein